MKWKSFPRRENQTNPIFQLKPLRYCGFSAKRPAGFEEDVLHLTIEHSDLEKQNLNYSYFFIVNFQVYSQMFGSQYLADAASARESVSREELQTVTISVRRGIKPPRPRLSDSLPSQSHQRYSTYIFSSYSVLFPQFTSDSVGL